MNKTNFQRGIGLTPAESPKNLEFWLDELGEMDAVVLGAVLQELNRMTASDETSVNQLAAVILKDPSLTSKLLKVSNSVVFNPSGASVTTISRAIMHTGFNTIKAICVSAIVMERLLKEYPRQFLVERLALSLHAAVQARSLCVNLKSDAKEEVFVAGLLLHLGEMLILSHDHPLVDDACAFLEKGASTKEVESVLGVSFPRLTRSLAEHWNLGGTLIEALYPKKSAGDKAKAVIIGEQLAVAIDKGWDSSEMKLALKNAAAFTRRKPDEVTELVENSSKEAAILARSYGHSEVVARLLKSNIEGSGVQEESAKPSILQPDAQVQLQVLQDISLMLMEKIVPSQLFQLVLEGLHRGVGLERVLFAICNQSRTQITAKYLLGEDMVNWREKFSFPYRKGYDDLWGRVLSQPKTVWFGHADFTEYRQSRPQALVNLVKCNECLVGPLLVGDREIGVLYADMGITKRALNDNYFIGFKHFLQQTIMSLSVRAQNS